VSRSPVGRLLALVAVAASLAACGVKGPPRPSGAPDKEPANDLFRPVEDPNRPNLDLGAPSLDPGTPNPDPGTPPAEPAR
jgi:hypothetical protein